jgi:predicted TIM-barrel fold metal-dependent hydrolase
MNSLQSRRAFLKQATVGALAAVAGKAAESKPPLIIDTHTHFYDATRPEGVPWPPHDDKLLYRRVLPADYIALPKPQPVNGTVVVEASSWLEDNQWILNLAERERFIVGFVGNLAVGEDGFEKNLSRFARNPLFRGIRVGADKLNAARSQKQFKRHLSMLADHDLALDVLGGPDQLPDVVFLASELSGLRIVIDHVANLRIDGKPAPPSWRDGMQAAGAHANVFCKVSGLVEGTGQTDGKAPAQAEFYRPVLDTIWGAFGPRRLIYGSNWPVSERFAPCAVVQQIVADYFGTKGGPALEQVFAANARDAYKWVRR